MLTARSAQTATRSPSHGCGFSQHEIARDGPVAIGALCASGFRLPSSGILLNATPAQLRTAKRHLVDTIDQLPHIVLVCLVPQLVIALRIRHQTGHERPRIIRNAHTISREQTQRSHNSCSFTPIQSERQCSSPPFQATLRSSRIALCKTIDRCLAQAPDQNSTTPASAAIT